MLIESNSSTAFSAFRSVYLSTCRHDVIADVSGVLGNTICSYCQSMLASNAQDCSGMRLVCSAGRGRINSLRRESSEVSRGFVRVSAARKNAQQASKQAKPSSQQVSTTCTIRTRTCEPQVSCDVHVNSLSCVRRVLVAH